MWAIERGHVEIVSMLVRTGAGLWGLDDEKVEELKKSMSLENWEWQLVQLKHSIDVTSVKIAEEERDDAHLRLFAMADEANRVAGRMSAEAHGKVERSKVYADKLVEREIACRSQVLRRLFDRSISGRI